MLTYQQIYEKITQVGRDYRNKQWSIESRREVFKKIAEISDIVAGHMNEKSYNPQTYMLTLKYSFTRLVSKLQKPANTVIRYLQTFKTAVDKYLMDTYQVSKGTLVIIFKGNPRDYKLRGSVSQK